MSQTLKIEHYPNKEFTIFSFTPVFSVDLNKSVQKKLKKGEQLTNATALRILKEISWKSAMLAFFTKSVVLIYISFSLIATGLSISPLAGTALFALRIFLCALGGGILGYSIENKLNGFLPKLSGAYEDQCDKANEYIRTLKAADDEMRFVLA